MTQLSLDRRDYQRNPDRNGTYGQLGQYGRLFFGENNHSLTIGGGYHFGRAKFDRFAYSGYFIPLHLTFNVGEKWELTPSLSYMVENYKLPATVLESEDRKDKKIRAGLDIAYKLTETLQVELNYGYNNTDSNRPLYEYVQHVVGLGLAWGF
jgi:maltoporin